MIFQILDDRKECYGVYSNGKFRYDRIPENVTGTWSWDQRLIGRSIDYASVYSGGKTLSAACPEALRPRLEKREERIRSFINAAVNSKIKLDDLCMFDIVPEQHLMHYCEIKNEICSWIFERCDRPANHDFLVDLHQMSHQIAQNPVIIDQNTLKKASKIDQKALALLNNLNGQNRPILYNAWGSKTGRLTLKNGSFPIMNLKKDIANCVVPKNDLFIQFDTNGAEIRTFISLSTGTHPVVDIHEWNMENVFDDITDRDQAKKKFLAWFYNPNSSVVNSEHYNRDLLLKKYYNNNIVRTPFGRSIEADDFHALNYLLQSSSSDNCMLQCIKINKFLNNNKSFVHSVVHDSLTIDLSFDDRNLLPQIQEIFEDTQLGWFRSSVHAGHNLRDLKEISWS